MNAQKMLRGLLLPIIIFSIMLTACPDGGESSPGITTPTTPPAIPTDVKATAKSSTIITVSWERVSNADSYEVHYQTGSLPITRLTTVVQNQFTHTGLQPNTTYFYYISARNEVGESAMSSRASAITHALSESN